MTDLVKMRIHKVTPEEVDQLRAAGFNNMTVDDLVKFRIHKVSPEFVKTMTIRTISRVFAPLVYRMPVMRPCPPASTARIAVCTAWSVHGPWPF